jgi:PAS domain S-box-containing protein
MHTLHDVMTTPVTTVAPETPVSDALHIMEKQKISSLVVARDKKPLGVFTERALIQLRVGGSIDYSWPIHRVMSTPPLTAPVRMDYREAYQLLLNHRIRHLVVVDEQGLLVGIVTGTDFLSHLGLEYFMEFKNVGQVMMHDVLTLPPSAPAFTAMKMMHDRRVSSLVIEEDGYPSGIVTERDLLRLIRARIALEDIVLAEVMSSPVHTIFSDISSHRAARVLLEKGVRRLVVINSDGHCVGIITETDLIKGLRTSYTDHLKEVINQQARQLREVKRQMAEAEILDAMLHSASDIAIAIMDLDGTILHHNQAAITFFSTDRHDLIGQNAKKLLACGGMLETFNQGLEQALGNGRSVFTIRRQEQEGPVYQTTTLFAIHDRQNNTTGFGLIGLDTTDLKQALAEVESKKQELEEANIALRVMLDQHTKTRESVEEQISIRLKSLIMPYLDLLRQRVRHEQDRETLNIIAAHMDSLTSSFTSRGREIFLNLSPRESTIADLVRQGKTSKEIAAILGIGVRTVESYRNNLRKKLGIRNEKISLRTYLSTHLNS